MFCNMEKMEVTLSQSCNGNETVINGNVDGVNSNTTEVQVTEGTEATDTEYIYTCRSNEEVFVSVKQPFQYEVAESKSNDASTNNLVSGDQDTSDVTRYQKTLQPVVTSGETFQENVPHTSGGSADVEVDKEIKTVTCMSATSVFDNGEPSCIPDITSGTSEHSQIFTGHCDVAIQYNQTDVEKHSALTALQNITKTQSILTSEFVDQTEDACEISEVAEKVTGESENTSNKSTGTAHSMKSERVFNILPSCPARNFRLECKQPSSEIKERVMSYLTKHLDVEDVSSKMQGHHKRSLEEQDETIAKSNENEACVEKTADVASVELDMSRMTVTEDSSPLTGAPHPTKKSYAHCLCSFGVSAQISAPLFPAKSVGEPMEQVNFDADQSEQFSEGYKNASSNSEAFVPDSSDTIHVGNGDPQSLPSNSNKLSSENQFESTQSSVSLQGLYANKNSVELSPDQNKIENGFEKCDLETSANFNQNNTSSLTHNDNSHGTHVQTRSQHVQQAGLNSSAFSFSSKSAPTNADKEKSVFCATGMKITAPPNTPVSLFACYTPPTIQGCKTNLVPPNFIFSSGRNLSFQPLTTPCVSSPIFSSKPCDYRMVSNPKAVFPVALPVTSSGAVNGSSALLVPSSFASESSSCTKRSKSSEAALNSQQAVWNFAQLPSTNKDCQLFGKYFFGKAESEGPSRLSTTAGESSLVFGTSFGRPQSSAVLSGSGSAADQCSLTFCKAVEEPPAKAPSKIIPLPPSLCYRNPLTSGTGIGSTENPYAKKPPVQSIGLFNTTPTPLFGEIFFKPTCAFSFSSRNEKQEEMNSSPSDTNSVNLPDKISANEMQFVSSRNSENQPNNVPCITSTFVLGSAPSLNLQGSPEKFTFNTSDSLTSLDTPTSLPNFGDHERMFVASTSSPPHFTFNAESTSHITSSRGSRKSKKACKQIDKGLSRYPKEIHISYITPTKGTSFKPVYGSDVRVEKGDVKNVIVRYQNIVCMGEHTDMSPEELRSQFYAKTLVSGPFKFSASTNKCNIESPKKTRNRETQTEENLTPKSSQLTEIWRALECPVCLDVVLPPVYQCEQGHHACLTCWNKVVTCPLCKRAKSGTRNYMAEALIEQVPLPCRYHIEGCKETVQHTNKVSHEETCMYRMYQCPVPSCNQAHSYQNMCKHFKKVHNTLLHHEGHSVGKGEKFCDVLYKEYLSPSLIHAFDITKWGLFFLREVRVHHTSALLIQFMPASSDPAAYFYHLEVCDHHDCRKECYKGRVFPISKSVQEIVDQEEYLSLSQLILKTVKKSAPLKIVVTIWQLKPAFTLSME